MLGVGLGEGEGVCVVEGVGDGEGVGIGVGVGSGGGLVSSLELTLFSVVRLEVASPVSITVTLSDAGGVSSPPQVFSPQVGTGVGVGSASVTVSVSVSVVASWAIIFPEGIPKIVSAETSASATVIFLKYFEY